MKSFDRLIFNVLFALVIPVICLIIFWWVSFLFTHNTKPIIIAAMSGLCLGIIIDLLLRYLYKPDVYKIPVYLTILVYLFYNTWAFSSFMGVPVFNLVPGVFAGFYRARRMIYEQRTQDCKSEIQRVSIFTALITGIVCLFSATIALISKSTPDDLEGMLRLPFDLTMPMLIGIIVIGGLFLILAQYFLTRIVMQQTLKSAAGQSD